MIESKIRKVGNSAVMTLTTEMLTLLDAKEGDALFVVREDDGSLKIMALLEMGCARAMNLAAYTNADFAEIAAAYAFGIPKGQCLC